MLTFIVFIIAFTSVFGRWWCGWACPQTIFMEFIFRRIEYWIEGDAQQQRLLANAPWDLRKLSIKGTKQAIFYFISFIIANLFLAYIIGIDELYKIIKDPVTEHLGGFISLLVFSGVFFFVFSRMREQVCLVVCPYGRLQGVLLDKDTTVVAYDHVRGEPRGKLTSTIVGQGDCIDCKLCVNVCPTGIDIRNGTQLECINCTACIDACDSIMEKVHRLKGLVRFASHNNIVNRSPESRRRCSWAPGPPGGIRA
jgi:cytochrome c oxidase accessory protein FixG